MARYGCLVIGVVIALAILFVVVFFWSGWLNRPVGHSIAPSAAMNIFTPGSGIQSSDSPRSFSRSSTIGVSVSMNFCMMPANLAAYSSSRG